LLCHESNQLEGWHNTDLDGSAWATVKADQECGHDVINGGILGADRVPLGGIGPLEDKQFVCPRDLSNALDIRGERPWLLAMAMAMAPTTQPLGARDTTGLRQKGGHWRGAHRQPRNHARGHARAIRHGGAMRHGEEA